MSTFPCLLAAWQRHEKELRGFLLQRLGDPYGADDLLQDVFLKSMLQGAGFCLVSQPRAWLFQVARHALIDHARQSRPQVELTEALLAPACGDQRAPVEQLDTCLIRNLETLSAEDQELIRLCDLQGMKQQLFADAHGLSLSAVKTRLLRARQRLHQALLRHCQVGFDENGHVSSHQPRIPHS